MARSKKKYGTVATISVRLGDWSWYLLIVLVLMVIFILAASDPWEYIIGPLLMPVFALTLLLSLLSFTLGCIILLARLFTEEEAPARKYGWPQLLFSSPFLILLLYLLSTLMTN